MAHAQAALQALSDNDLTTMQTEIQLTIQNESPELQYNLAEELYALGFTQEAKQLYQAVLRLFPDEDIIKTTLADIAVSDGDFDEALNYLTTIDETSDAYAASLLTSADVYQAMGLPEVSEQKLLIALRQFPDEPVIRFALAELYFQQAKYQQANTFYEALVEADITMLSQVDIKKRLAISYANSGEFEGAITLYESMQAAFLTPDDQFYLGFLYLQVKENQKAIDYLTKLQANSPEYTTLYTYLAQAQENLKQYREALQTVQTGIGYDEYNENLYQKGAQLALELNELTTAQQLLNQLLIIDPDNLQAKQTQLTLFEQQHDNQSIVNYLTDESLELTSDMHYQLAKAQNNLGEINEANQHYLLAYADLKTQPGYLRDLGLFFYNNGQNQQALEAITSYLKLEPTDTQMQEYLTTLQ